MRRKNLFTTALTVSLLLFILPVAPAQTTETTLSALPSIVFPTGPKLDDGLAYYSMGYGGSVRGELAPAFAPWLFGRLSFDYEFMPINGSSQAVSFAYGGGDLGLSYSPFSRLALRAAAGGGLYLAAAEAGTVRNPYAEAGGELLIRFTPAVALNVGAKYRYAPVPSDVLYEGVSVQAGLVYDLAGSRKGTNIRLDPAITPVFPLFYSYYDKNPFGAAQVVNRESIPIQNLRLSFYAKQYMDSPRICGELESLAPGAQAELPVYGLFNDAIFRVTEGTKAAGEFTLEYYYLGRKTTRTIPVTLAVQNRNAMTWDDDRKAAAFVTAKDPAVLGFAKNVAATVRAEQATPAISMEFRTALGIFQTLKIYGIGYAVDPATPFDQFSASDTAVDFLQFPGQTLSYRAGDCDDLTVLYAALLESVGIETALVTVPGHIFLAFNPALSPENAARAFANDTDYAVLDGKVWIPVEVTLVKDGFLRAWSEGSRGLANSVADGTAALYPVRDAWKTYEPVGFAESGALIALPAQESLATAYRTELDRFSRAQVADRVAGLEGLIQKGSDSDKNANRLGILYAQYGLISEARKQFEFAIRKSGLPQAIINLGNVEYLQGNYAEAKKRYETALRSLPGSSACLVGLARTQQALGDTAGFNMTVAELKAADSAAVAAYFPGGGASRASDTDDRRVELWGE